MAPASSNFDVQLPRTGAKARRPKACVKLG
jgi:hypothetical protein